MECRHRLRALMIPKIFGRLFVAALACCLLNGCGPDFHLVLFNNTDDAIIIHRRTQDPTPLYVVAGISGEITGVSTDDFIIERQGRLLHYRFPSAYTYPSAEVPAGYQRRVRRIGRAFYFQLNPDNRIYILRQHDSLEETKHADQPAGFPLVPH
jgi:hypothetical protein